MIKRGPFVYRHSVWVVVLPSLSIMAVAVAGAHGCSLAADTVPEGAGGSGQGGSAQMGSGSQASSSGTPASSSSTGSSSSGGDPCNNGMKDGTETDIDCGGSCTKCSDGQACNDNNDCTSDACVGGMCCNNACGTCQTCSMGQCTDVTPGTSGMCANMEVCGSNATCVGVAGASCIKDGDCLSGTCSNGIKTCAKGGTGTPCATGADCTSTTCTANKCT